LTNSNEFFKPGGAEFFNTVDVGPRVVRSGCARLRSPLRLTNSNESFKPGGAGLRSPSRLMDSYQFFNTVDVGPRVARSGCAGRRSSSRLI